MAIEHFTFEVGKSINIQNNPHGITIWLDDRREVLNVIEELARKARLMKNSEGINLTFFGKLEKTNET